MDDRRFVVTFFYDPFFWALISMLAVVGGGLIVSGSRFGKSRVFGVLIVITFILGRGILALPFCPQPRFEAGGWHLFVGVIIFVAGLIFSIPVLFVRPLTPPHEHMKLETSGFYAVVRNPIYFGELLWYIGWSIMFRSIIGLALVPLWWCALLFHTLVEEENLERKLGEKYLVYKRMVRGRIIPGLPI
jgi:protein-S-isoprenylcysteine O-methyltransferase Ste14